MNQGASQPGPDFYTCRICKTEYEPKEQGPHATNWCFRCERATGPGSEAWRAAQAPAPQAQEELIGAPGPAIVEPDERYSVFSHGGPRGVICAVSDGGDIFIRPDATREELHTALLAILSDEGVPLPEPQPPAPASQGGLVWTKEKPTETDWYWTRRIGFPNTAGVEEIRVDDNGCARWKVTLHDVDEWEPIDFGLGLEFCRVPAPAAPEAGAPGTQGAT